MNVEKITGLSGILVGLVVVVWIIVRQSSWRPVRLGKLWILPVILVGDGVINLAAEVTVIPHYPVRSLDAALLVFEMALSVAIGVLMGVLAQFRHTPTPEAAAPPRKRSELESRTGWVAIVLWIVVILVRAGIGIWGTFNEATLVESGGGVLLVLGLNRGARVVAGSAAPGHAVTRDAPRSNAAYRIAKGSWRPMGTLVRTRAPLPSLI
jgi:hypothetical protein